MSELKPSLDSADSENGRDRLLKAAVRLFGRDGYDATSIRTVAEEAGVSWGLVRFYFGSKEGLREAAEKYVVRVYLDRAAQGATAIESSFQELMAVAIQTSEDVPLIAQFLRRAIIEQRPIALEFLDRLLHTDDLDAQLYAEFPNEAWLKDPTREVATRIGYLVLAPQFKELLGRDIFSAEELKLRNSYWFRINQLIRAGIEAERTEKGACAAG